MANWFSKLMGKDDSPSPPRKVNLIPAPVAQAHSGALPLQVEAVLLNEFEVEKELGRGGMGKVWLVRSRTTGRHFAVKEVIVKDDAHRRAFLAELQTWIDLPEHPNILACRFFRTVGDEIFIFADYIEGGSLADWIAQGRLVSIEQKLDVAIQFARGLHAIHEHGLIHQDVKPGNVLMSKDGTPKVADFGLARVRQRRGSEVSSSDATAIGKDSILVSSGGMTPAYASPEQRAGQALSRKTDIWSWGVSVLDMFAGDVSCPHGGHVAAEVLEASRESEAGEDAMIQMPEDVSALLHRCFQRSPQNRPENLSEVVSTFKNLYQKFVGHEYQREFRAEAQDNNRILPIHDRRAVSGVQWVDPSEWLVRILEIEGVNPAKYQLPKAAAARTRKAQAVEDLAIYDDIQRRLEKLVVSGRKDLEMKLSMVYMDKALVHKTAGDPEGASSMYERAAAIREKLALDGRSESADNLALVYQNHASLLFDLGDKEKSLEVCDHALEIRERLVVEEQQDQFADGLAVLYMNKGVALAALDQWEFAVRAYDEAIDLLSRLIREQSRLDLDKDLARAYQNKATSLKSQMSFVQAFRCYDDAIAIFERLIRDGQGEVRVDLAGACMNKASLFLDLGHKQENIEISRRAVALLEELVTREGHTELSHLLARAYTKEANALLVAGEYEVGLVLSDRAVELWKRVVQLDGRHEFHAEFQQAVLCRDTNRETLAIRTYSPAREVIETPPNAADRPKTVVIQLLGKAGEEVIPMQFDALINRAHELASEGRFAVADILCQQAYSLRPEDKNILALASACALKIGHLERASELLHSLVRLAPNDKNAWLNLSLCLSEQKLHKRQIFALQKVIEINALDGPAHALLADSLFFEKQFDEAVLVLVKLKDIAGWEIQAVCKWAFILAHIGKGMFAYMLLNKTVEKHKESAALWLMMARVLSTIPEHRQQAINAAKNAAFFFSKNPRQLQPDEKGELDEMLIKLGQ